MIPPPNWHFERDSVRSGARQRPLELLHDNVRKFGTVFNTVAPGTALSGVLRRKGDAR